MVLLKFALYGVLVVATVVVAERRLPIGKAEFNVEPAAEFTTIQEVDESYRLPKATVPTHYTLHLRTTVHEGDREFQGSVDIHLDVVEQTDKITVHNRGLTIVSATLYRVEGEELMQVEQPTTINDELRDQLTFQCSTLLTLGNYVLKVEFTGDLQTSSSSGFFRKYYRDENENRRYLASTQFEPTRARMAFPCYDEPTLKATFTVSITHHKSYNAVSNMPQNGPVIVQADDFVTTNFLKSQRMSTYLLAFVVSDFETRNFGNQQIHARPNAIDETEFALAAGDKVLLELNMYTGISYYNYMPKLAQIAIPDWGSGAMENWGLVTYGEPALLFDPDVNTYRTLKGIATVIAHEYAHQWFGNLVTTDWWQYIWLNEGFATLYGYYGAHLAYPEQQYMDMFQLDVLQLALGPDSRESTRPMNWNAATPAEISGLFDRVAYEKSGSVLNMFRTILGDATWRRGLNTYLKNRQLDAAVPGDLYAALDLAAMDNRIAIPDCVTVLMETWTTAAGYPVLNVRRNYQTQEVIISQERFLADKKLPNDHVWAIPYSVANQRDLDFEVGQFSWLMTKATKVVVDINPEEWMIFNRQQTGFYRVNYDERNWELITNAMIRYPESIHHYNRAQLIDDAFNLARADVLDFSVVLRLLTALTNDQDYLPWAAANNVLTYLYNKVRGTAHYDRFVYYVHTLVGNVYTSLRMDSVGLAETLKEKYLKQLVSTWACRIGYTECLEKSQETFQMAVRGNTGVHPDISSVVYCYGVQHATDDEFLWLYRRMFSSKNSAERTLLIDAMGCSLKEDHLSAFLTSSIGAGVGTEVNYYDSERTRVLQAVYSASRTGVDALIKFLDNWDMADDLIYWLDQPAFNNAIASIATRTNTQEEFDRLKQLFTTVGSLAPDTVVDAAMATVKANFDWYDSLEGLIVLEFLEKYAGWVEA